MTVFVLEEFPEALGVLRVTKNHRIVLHRVEAISVKGVRDRTLCGLAMPQVTIEVPAAFRIHFCKRCAEAVNGQARIERLT